MKALVKIIPEKGIWMEEVPMPHVGINDVLIKIKKTAICGTDLHIYKWDDWSARTIKTPMTIGHEYMGEIVDKGRGVKNIQIGDRVPFRRNPDDSSWLVVAGGRRGRRWKSRARVGR